MVSSFDWVNVDNLKGIDEEFHEIVRGSLFVDDARCAAICSALKGSVGSLIGIMNSCRHTYPSAGREWDVIEDIAYSGSDDK